MIFLSSCVITLIIFDIRISVVLLLTKKNHQKAPKKKQNDSLRRLIAYQAYLIDFKFIEAQDLIIITGLQPRIFK
jgi:uncharacterized membrane protein